MSNDTLKEWQGVYYVLCSWKLHGRDCTSLIIDMMTWLHSNTNQHDSCSELYCRKVALKKIVTFMALVNKAMIVCADSNKERHLLSLDGT